MLTIQHSGPDGEITTTFDYDYQRLTGINYPDHPENNVKYYYGGRNASQNRIGRLMLRGTERVSLNTSMARWVK